ncbi:HAD family hydrolase [uncultured Serinicoccus sp.]|uniref:sulfotransferase-like domain-containing protein n=1 Tax=uncultured Serinicoccus sp. TaxID=735514 RepID=UPI00261371AC|nr:HAD family hydrolase [uncultured Serinicoccus sp.]
MTVRLAMWSGPRNISTAMMRAWENRPDSEVFDEPFYAAYLHRTGIDHPAREEVIASQPTDPAEVARALLAPTDAAVSYSKQMTHHYLDGDDLTWAREVRHVLLVRDPAEVVASYVRSREACQPEDIGLLQQLTLSDLLGSPPVIDAADFLQDPEAYLRWLCDWLGIAFTDRMLSWPAGLRDSDGVWAPHWYDAVVASTGFTAYRPREVQLSDHDAAVAEACRPAYEALRERALRP